MDSRSSPLPTPHPIRIVQPLTWASASNPPQSQREIKFTRSGSIPDSEYNGKLFSLRM
ncbi:hypothetical protein CPB84DRAFT_1773678 [Gymnopilus junonius]|uniref:Uncharacterized protein n=1 Tax=Gymnopilus junonius TaxID=109634 RepID=A0A9P5NRK6_GYMJU|nr:hypothetical protein CPB84DRAFT_1773678 [Gymnopilus junonius]